MRRIISFVAVLLFSSAAVAVPPSREIVTRERESLADLQRAVAQEPDIAAKLRLLAEAMSKESSDDARLRIMQMAEKAGGTKAEPFFTEIVQNEKNSWVRGAAVVSLGRIGSEASVELLGKIARSDPKTPYVVGDIGGEKSARREAIFALAELGGRLPDSSKKIQQILRELRDLPRDGETLDDARTQALYQLTHDESLLKPFYGRLQSDKPEERVAGIIAFRFLKLDKAPVQLVELLKDKVEEVRSTAAMVLGEISDPQAARPLMDVAADRSAGRGARCNAIYALRRIKAAGQLELARKLMDDPDLAVSTQAAITIYTLTGEKTAKYPEGYNGN